MLNRAGSSACRRRTASTVSCRDTARPDAGSGDFRSSKFGAIAFNAAGDPDAGGAGIGDREAVGAPFTDVAPLVTPRASPTTDPGVRSFAADGLELRLGVRRYAVDTVRSATKSAWLEDASNCFSGGVAFGAEPHRYPTTPAAATTMTPTSRAAEPNFGTVETGSGGSGSRSGARASRVRSSATAMSPANAWRFFRFQGGSGSSGAPRCGAAPILRDASAASLFRGVSAASASLGASFVSRSRFGRRALLGAYFNGPSFNGPPFNDPSFNDPPFNGSSFNGPSFNDP